MRKILMAAGAVALLSGGAYAATLALPAVTFTAPVSTKIACDEAGAAALMVPVLGNKVIFACGVDPANWTGTVSLPEGSAFTAPSGTVGNTFNITLTATQTVPATLQPGTLTTTP
jgi:hypothetical protein